MNAADLCSTLQQTVPPHFVCSPAAQEGVRVRTTMLYPDGGVVDVFVLERDGGYVVTDFGDALGWLWMQSVSRRLSHKQDALIENVCQALRIEHIDDQLTMRNVSGGALCEAATRVARAAVRVAELCFPFRSQALQNAAAEVDKRQGQRETAFKRRGSRQGRSTRE